MATALLEILVLGGGSLAAYELRSSMYSPERAVTDYFAAQSQGDVSGMVANATFQQGSNFEFFSEAAIAAMMQLPQNRDVHNVKVVSSQAIDATAQAVSVSMIWGGQHRSQTYTVRKDNSRFRDFVFRYWRIVIPFATIHITLPNQPGPIQVDGITPATSDVSSVQAVDGYHRVTMRANDFYDRASQVVDGVDSPPTAEFALAVSSGAVALAAAAVKLAFPNCDASVYTGCFGGGSDLGHEAGRAPGCRQGECLGHLHDHGDIRRHVELQPGGTVDGDPYAGRWSVHGGSGLQLLGEQSLKPSSGPSP